MKIIYDSTMYNIFCYEIYIILKNINFIFFYNNLRYIS